MALDFDVRQLRLDATPFEGLEQSHRHEAFDSRLSLNAVKSMFDSTQIVASNAVLFIFDRLVKHV